MNEARRGNVAMTEAATYNYLCINLVLMENVVFLYKLK